MVPQAFSSLQVSSSRHEVLKHIKDRRERPPAGDHALLLRLILDAAGDGVQARRPVW